MKGNALKTSLIFSSILCNFFLVQNLSAQQIIVYPYLQPGNASSLSKELKVVMWQTDSVAGTYKVSYKIVGNEDEVMEAKISKVNLHLNNKRTILYSAVLSKLKFDEQYFYSVTRNGKTLTSSTFSTRTRKNKTQFVVMGDCGYGTAEQSALAKQMALQNPQFVLTTGDIAYMDGRESEYINNFFPSYLPIQDTTNKLMQSTPFYLGIGNHDMHGTDLNKFNDGLGYFYYSNLPLNAPIPKYTATVTGDPKKVSAFIKATNPKFPRILNYSFDHGNVHITYLDANGYINPLDDDLIEWIKNDISNCKADWKFVAFHCPSFSSSNTHYTDQLMRLLSPLLEALKVDVVFNGHVHNYQRTLPLRFVPQVNKAGTQYVIGPNGEINGTFTLDNSFDGIRDTTPEGVIYIVSGAGGAPLYDRGQSNKPELWKHEPKENWAPFTQKLISDRYSFTLIKTESKTLTLQQIDLKGEVIDQITITKE